MLHPISLESRRPRPAIWLQHAIVAGALACFSVPTRAQQVTQLSELLPHIVAGAVTDDYLATPDGALVIYRAEQDRRDRTELYVRPSDGSGESVRISPALPLEESIGRFVLSPDGSQVAFTMGVFAVFAPPPRLYAAAVDGSSPPVLLTPTPPASTFEFAFSADSSRLVFLTGGGGVSGDGGLFSIPIDASTPAIRLSPSLPYPQSVSNFQLDGHSNRAVYRSDQDTPNVDELYSAPIDGSAPAIRISAPLSGTHQVMKYAISSTGERVVYSAQEAPSWNLHSAPLDGSAAAVQLNNLGQNCGDLKEFRISPDGQQVALVSDLETYDRSELFRIPIDGSAPAERLSGAMTPGGEVWRAEFTPDGTRLVYVADQLIDSFYDIFSVPLFGGQPEVKLNAALPPNGPVESGISTPLTISPDSSRVVYIGFQDAGSSTALYSAAIDGTQNRRLSTFESPQGWFPFFETDPSSTTVVYQQVSTLASVGTLWRVPLAGGSQQRIAGDGEIPEAVLDPTGQRVVYRLPEGQGFELRSRLVDLSAPSARLNEDLPSISVGDIESFALSPDERWVVYLGDQEADGKQELFSTRIGGGDSFKLNPPLEQYGDVTSFKLSADSQWVVFTADPGEAFGVSLYSARLDGSFGPVLLSPQLLLTHDVVAGSEDHAWQNGFTISADSQWVVYNADQAVNNRSELYRAAIDGSGGALRVNPPISGQRDVHPHFRISPDSRFIVYLATQEVFGRDELYSVPMDLSGPVVNLNPDLVTNGDVQRGFEVTADSSTVVYRADQETDNVQELYSVPIDGSSAALKLNGPLPVGSDIWSFQLSPLGDTLVYSGDERTQGVVEAFSVPVDGSLPGVRLNADLSPGEFLQGNEISPDGTRLLYSVSDPSVPRASLYSVPLAGGVAPLRLNSSPNDWVRGFRISANSRWAVYLLPLTAAGAPLRRVPIDGSAAATPLGSSLPPSTALGTWEIGARARRVAFVADLLRPQRPELWLIDPSLGLAPVRMNQPLTQAGRVERVVMSRNLQSFVFLARTSETSGVELFSSRRLTSFPPR